jgi:hypothetical protein
MEEFAVRILLGVLGGIGAIVCLVAGIAFACWCVGRARHAIQRQDVIWQHQDAVQAAIAEWKDRNPTRLAELERLRESLDRQ